MRALVLFCLFAAAAAADERSARIHFRLGQEHFKVGDYEGALREFEAGYRDTPQPLFLYNIALAERRLGLLDKALASYRQFLEAAPNARERAEVERRIIDIEWALANQPRPEPPAPSPSPTPEPQVVVTPPPPPPAPPPDRRPRALLGAGLGVAGLGVALVAAGGGLYALAVSDNDALSSPPRGTVFDPAVEQRRDTYQSASIGLMVAGGVVAAAGVVVAALSARHPR
jgi:tetratricopeptide (TPR) repeat protein